MPLTEQDVPLVKFDPVTRQTATRTAFPDDERWGAQAWVVVNQRNGPKFARTADVESWLDVTLPTAPE